MSASPWGYLVPITLGALSFLISRYAMRLAAPHMPTAEGVQGWSAVQVFALFIGVVFLVPLLVSIVGTGLFAWLAKRPDTLRLLAAAIVSTAALGGLQYLLLVELPSRRHATQNESDRTLRRAERDRLHETTDIGEIRSTFSSHELRLEIPFELTEPNEFVVVGRGTMRTPEGFRLASECEHRSELSFTAGQHVFELACDGDWRQTDDESLNTAVSITFYKRVETERSRVLTSLSIGRRIELPGVYAAR